ncbi:MAG: hypothetical protein ACM30G_21365, partial [Micromonosporaceae bacterium]
RSRVDPLNASGAAFASTRDDFGVVRLDESFVALQPSFTGAEVLTPSVGLSTQVFQQKGKTMQDTNREPAILEVLSYSDWEDGEVTPHTCGLWQTP